MSRRTAGFEPKTTLLLKCISTSDPIKTTLELDSASDSSSDTFSKQSLSKPGVTAALAVLSAGSKGQCSS